MSPFIKEGVCAEAEPRRKTELAALLRFESTALPAGSVTGLDAVLERAKAGQAADKDQDKTVYYLVAQRRGSAEASPCVRPCRSRRCPARSRPQAPRDRQRHRR